VRTGHPRSSSTSGVVDVRTGHPRSSSTSGVVDGRSTKSFYRNRISNVKGIVIF